MKVAYIPVFTWISHLLFMNCLIFMADSSAEQKMCLFAFKTVDFILLALLG